MNITNSDDLEVGKLYWLICKITADASTSTCQETEGTKYFGHRMWTDNTNPQGFKRWFIFPANVPGFIQFKVQQLRDKK